MENNICSIEQIENLLANLTVEDRDKVTEFLEKCNFESKYSVRVRPLEIYSNLYVNSLNFRIDFTVAPDCLKQNAKVLLDLVEKMSVDEQILIIEWAKLTKHNSCNQEKVFQLSLPLKISKLKLIH